MALDKLPNENDVCHFESDLGMLQEKRKFR